MPVDAGGVSTMTEASNYTASELLAVMSARLLLDGQIVFAGVGIPLLAATLAQRVHAPSLTILFEGAPHHRRDVIATTRVYRYRLHGRRTN